MPATDVEWGHGLRPVAASAPQLLQHHSGLAARPANSNRFSNPASTVFGLLGLVGLNSHGVGEPNHLARPQQLKHIAVRRNLRPYRTHTQLDYSVTGGPQAVADSDAVGTTQDSFADATQDEVLAAAEPHPAAASHSSDRKSTAAAALARVQQAAQRVQTATAGLPQHTAAAEVDGHVGLTGGISNSGWSQHQQQQQQQQRQLVQPVRPAYDREDALQQLEQQSSAPSDHLLTWRGKHPSSSTQRQPLQQQHLVHQQQHTTMSPQQQQLLAPPLEPSIGPSGKTYLTSPVSFVAADTSTKALAGSISIAFAVHQHQLMFAVGPHALGICCKALATARLMLATENEGRPMHILMQPTLRGGRTVRHQSYALDIARVGELPMKPGGSSSSSDSDVVYDATQRQRQQQKGPDSCCSSSSSRDPDEPTADVKFVHITTSSNEIAAARSLVENMPARGQTVMRVNGPFATETAVLAVALARPSFKQKYGQDLAILVMWNQNKMYRHKQNGLLLAVFRCAVGSFPPEVLLLPPSQRKMKRQQYWQRQQQQGRHGR